MSSSRIPVAVVGATGLAGQQFLASLAGHPLFEAKKLVASSRSAGKTFADAVKDDKGASKWFCSEPLSDEYADLVVEDSATMTTDGVRLVFSAVEADVARELEPRCAANVPVISTASAFRYEPDVPVFLPGRQLGPRGADRRAAQEARLEGLRRARARTAPRSAWR